MNMKILVALLVLAVSLNGCSYTVPSSSGCQEPAVAMTDVNGNTVCVIPSEDNVLEDSNENVVVSDKEVVVSDKEVVVSDKEVVVADETEVVENETEVVENETEVVENETEVVSDKEVVADENVVVTDKEVVENETELVENEKDMESTEDLLVKTFIEGDLISFNLNAYDPDGDDLSYSFSEPLDEDGEWQTEDGDEGSYVVTITVSDGEHEVSQKVMIVVKAKNNAPVLEGLDDVSISEGDLVEITPDAFDKDGDDLSYSFSEPLDEDGEWQTEDGDSGEYEIEVTVSDGKASDKESFILTVEKGNLAPVISGVSDVTVSEGETVSFSPEVEDPEGEDVIVSYSGWMADSSYTTTYDDSGEYEVTITASDGEKESSVTVSVTVEDVNRPPVFEIN